MNQNDQDESQQEHEVDSWSWCTFGCFALRKKLHKVTVKWLLVLLRYELVFHCCFRCYFNPHISFKQISWPTPNLQNHTKDNVFFCQLAAQSERTSKLDVQKEVQLLGVSDMICITLIPSTRSWAIWLAHQNSCHVQLTFKTWKWRAFCKKAHWFLHGNHVEVLSLDGKDLTTVHDHTCSDMTLLKRL